MAARAGVAVDTVRYYERVGLLPRAPRRESGYRVFDERTVERIQLVKHLQDLGLNLVESEGLLEALGPRRVLLRGVAAHRGGASAHRGEAGRVDYSPPLPPTPIHSQTARSTDNLPLCHAWRRRSHWPSTSTAVVGGLHRHQANATRPPESFKYGNS